LFYSYHSLLYEVFARLAEMKSGGNEQDEKLPR